MHRKHSKTSYSYELLTVLDLLLMGNTIRAANLNLNVWKVENGDKSSRESGRVVEKGLASFDLCGRQRM